MVMCTRGESLSVSPEIAVLREACMGVFLRNRHRALEREDERC